MVFINGKKMAIATAALMRVLPSERQVVLTA